MFRLNRNKQKTHPNSLKVSIFFRKFRVVSVCFGLLRNSSVCFGCFDIGSKPRNKPKSLVLVSRNKPKQTRNRSCFGLFRFELKFSFVCFEDTLPYTIPDRPELTYFLDSSSSRNTVHICTGRLERSTSLAGTEYLGSWKGVSRQLERGTSAAGTRYLGSWNGVPRQLERIPRQLERIPRQLERGTSVAGTGYLGIWNGVPWQLERGTSPAGTNTSAAGTGYLGSWNGLPNHAGTEFLTSWSEVPPRLERSSRLSGTE
jgi:hypothetical protein